MEDNSSTSFSCTHSLSALSVFKASVASRFGPQKDCTRGGQNNYLSENVNNGF